MSTARRRLGIAGLLASALLVGTFLAPDQRSAPTTDARWSDAAAVPVPASALDRAGLSTGTASTAFSAGAAPDWRLTAPVQNTSAATALAWGASSVTAAPRANVTQARATSLLAGTTTAVRPGGCTSSAGQGSIAGSAWSPGPVTPTGAASKQGRHTLAAGSSSSLCLEIDHSATGADLYRGHAGTDLDVRTTINGYSTPGTWTTADQSIAHRLSVPVPRPTTPTTTASSMCKQPQSGRYGMDWAWPTTGATSNAGVSNTVFRVFARSRDNTTWRVFSHTSYPQGWSGSAAYTYPSGTTTSFTSNSAGLNLRDDNDWWEFKVVAYPYTSNEALYVEASHVIRVVGRDFLFNIGSGFDECLVIPNDGQSHTVSSSKYSAPIRTTYNNGTDWTTLDTALVNR